MLRHGHDARLPLAGSGKQHYRTLSKVALAAKFHEGDVRSAELLLKVECQSQLRTTKGEALRGNESYQESSRISSL